MPLPQLTRERSLKLDIRRSARRSSDCASTATSSTVDLDGSSGSLWNSAYLSHENQNVSTSIAKQQQQQPKDISRKKKKKGNSRGVRRTKSAGSPMKKGPSRSSADLSRLFESSFSFSPSKKDKTTASEHKAQNKQKRKPGTRRSASTCSLKDLQRAVAKSKKSSSLSRHLQHESGSKKSSRANTTKSCKSVSSNPSLCASLKERNRFLHVDLLDEYEKIQNDYDSGEDETRSFRSSKEVDTSLNTLLLDELSQYDEIVSRYE